MGGRRGGRRPPRLAAAAAAAALLVCAGGLSACSSPDDDYVQRDGGGLAVDGQPYRFVGVNLFDAAASDSFSCRPQSRLTAPQLDRFLAAAHAQGATVLRFWAYQTYTDGGRDFSGVDAAIAAARRAGMRVMPVLEDGPGYCSTGPDQTPLYDVAGDTWYSQGYRAPLGSARLSYRDYAALMARHYADDPTVLGWTLVNEAETTARDAQGRSVLVDFTQDVAAVVHQNDPHHLVTLGTQANSAPGASGPDFRAVYSLPGMDFAEVHDYARNGSDPDAPMPGAVDGHLPAPSSAECSSTSAPLACSFAIAQQVRVPVVVGEVGVKAVFDDRASEQQRADVLGAKASAAFAAGASGYLVWQVSPVSTDGYDIDPTSDDPAITAMRRALDDAAPRSSAAG